MMKKIVEKIFFVHCPARGSVFALTLLFFGSWMCFSASIAAWGWELPEKISWRAFWTIRNGEQLFFLLLPLLFAGYFLLMLMRFLKSCPRSCRIGEKTPLLYGILFVFLAGVIVTGAFAVTDILTGLAEIKSGFMCGRKIFFPGGWSVPLSYAGMTAVILLWAVTVHWMAHLAGISFFKILGKASTGLIVLFLAAYSFSLAAAMEASRKTEEKFKTLEQLLDTPLTGRELFKYYTFPSEETDIFLDRLFTVSGEIILTLLSHRECYMISDPQASFEREEVLILQEKLENSPLVKYVEKMLDRPPPAICRLKRNLTRADMYSPELSKLLGCQIWRLHWAIREKDPQKARQAWKRLNHLRCLTYSEKNRFFGEDFLPVEEMHLKFLERWVNSGLMSVPDLEILKADVKKKRADLPQLQMTGFRSIVLTDTNRIFRLVHGLDLEQKKYREDFYAARFLLPEVWRLCTRGYRSLAQSCLVFSGVAKETADKEPVDSIFSCRLKGMESYFRKLDMHYLNLQRMIEKKLTRN